MARRLLVAPALLAMLVALCGATPELTPAQRASILAKPASVSAKEHVTRIPLEGTDHRGFYRCPYMRVNINGQGPFTFLFDTGSPCTIVTSKVIKAARLPVTVDRGGYHDLVRIKEMKVSGVTIKDVVAVRDDDYGVDGVFGFKVFGDMNVVFELQSRQLLVSPEPVPLPGSFELIYELPHNIPVIPVIVGADQVATLIDTGDDAYAWEVRTEDLKGATLAHPPSPAEQVLNGANASQTAVSTLESMVHVGPLTIEHAVVGINDALPVPDFGVDYLKDFNIEFNPKLMTVAFQPLSASAGTKISGNLGVGFTLHFDDKGTVQNVVPGSAAEQRGMHSGDKILSVNGRPIHGVNPRTWDAALATGKPLAVRWLEGTKERTDDFEVKEQR